MREHKTNHLRLKALVAEVTYAGKRFFLPLQNLRDTIGMSKTLIADTRKAFRLLKSDLNLRPQSLLPSREGSSPDGRDATAARGVPQPRAE